MSLVCEVKAICHRFLELCQYLIVPSHVCGQDAADDAFSHHTEQLRSHCAEDVTLRQLQDTESHGAMMVLQRRNVIVAQGQFSSCVYLDS